MNLPTPPNHARALDRTTTDPPTPASGLPATLRGGDSNPLRPIDWIAASLLEVEATQTIPDTRIGPSTIHGSGLFATRAFERDAMLGVLDGQIVDVRLHPQVIDHLEWNALSTDHLLVRAIRTSYGFINHSSKPNVLIDDGGRTLRSCRAIAEGEELTIDYFAQPVPAAYLQTREAMRLRAPTRGPVPGSPHPIVPTATQPTRNVATDDGTGSR